MKICMVVNKYPNSLNEPLVSGEIKNPFYLTQALKKMGEDITVITHNVNKNIWDFNGIKIYSIGESFLKGILRSIDRNVMQIKTILKLVKRERFDIFHGHVLTSIFGLIFLKKIRKITAPIIFTAHGTQIPEMYADMYGNINGFSFYDLLVKLNGYFQYYFDRCTYVNSHRVISVSNYQIKEMIRIYRVHQKKIVTIPNGVDTSFYKPNSRLSIKVRENMELKNKKIVLFVGRLVRKKGVQYLIKVAPKIIKEVPNVVFLIIGGMDKFALYELELRKAIINSGLKEKFIILKNIPEEDMPAYYNSADICVVPSINYESIPTVILEAAACGKPVVATNRWGIPEVLSYEDALVPEKDLAALANKIIEILKNEELAHILSKRNRNIALKFDWQKIAKKHQALYESLLGV